MNKRHHTTDFAADLDLSACSSSPAFKKGIIHLSQKYNKGETLVIEAPNASDRNIYTKSDKLNGQPPDKFRIT